MKSNPPPPPNEPLKQQVRDPSEGLSAFTVLRNHFARLQPDAATMAKVEADARLIAAAPDLLEYVRSSASAGCATARMLVARINSELTQEAKP